MYKKVQTTCVCGKLVADFKRVGKKFKELKKIKLVFREVNMNNTSKMCLI